MTTDTTILIADDELSVREIVRRYLEKEGYNIIEADNGPKTLQLLYEQKPDLLILDIMLPEISGIDFLKQMRSKSVFDKLPVIILSALADPKTIRAGLDAGADRYLTKPYLVNNLVKTITEVLRARGES